MQKGFTLVELAIVLIIIGLLIGGILVGQSIIQTVRTQALIKEVSQFDMAVSNFSTKFNGLPGDSSMISGGDNNGYIEGSSSNVFDDEIANFWSDLQQSGFEYHGKTFSPTLNGGVFDVNSATPNSPRVTADLPNVGVIAADQQIVDSIRYNAYTFNDWSLSGDISAGMDSFGGAFKPAIVAAIDRKLDDGHPWYGTVTDNGAVTYNAQCDNGNAGNIAYLVATDDPTCVMAIRVLSLLKNKEF